MMPVKTKGKYDAGFKLRVIHFAERFSNRAAGSKFGLNESTIRGWRKVKTNACHGDDDFKRAHGVETPKTTPIVREDFIYDTQHASSPRREDAFLCKKRQVRDRATGSSGKARTFLNNTQTTSGRKQKHRVFVGRSEYCNFPEVAVPFTVIAEKAIRALYRSPEVVVASSGPTNREVFAGLLGLRPITLPDDGS